MHVNNCGIILPKIINDNENTLTNFYLKNVWGEKEKTQMPTNLPEAYIQVQRARLFFVYHKFEFIVLFTQRNCFQVYVSQNKSYLFVKMSFICFTIILLVVLSILRKDGSKVKPKIVRSSAYEDVRDGKKATGDGSSSEMKTNEARCALKCTKDKNCLSFNLCGAESCYANSNDIFSINQVADILEKDANCKYFGVKKKESVPVCQDEGKFADIQDDSDPGEQKTGGSHLEWLEAIGRDEYRNRMESLA